MSRFHVIFAPQVSARVKARMLYSFRVFCAIYGHIVSEANSLGVILIAYGFSDDASAASGAICLPARYVERSPGDAAPRPQPALFAGERFYLFYGRDGHGRPDWLAEIFEWLSAADEMTVADRDSADRIPFESTIFARCQLPPARPHALMAMSWLGNYLEGGIAAEQLSRAPSPEKETDHWVVISHDIDIYWADDWPWRRRIERQFKNLVISYLESRRASVALSGAARLLKAFAGMRVDDFIPALMETEKGHEFRSTLFVIARSPHRRDANYGLAAIAPRLQQAAQQGFDIELHGSYTSIVEQRDLLSEVTELARFSWQPPIANRQHWLRFDSHQRLFNAIEHAHLACDSTLGFSNRVGFRNGASFSFPPYDFSREEPCNFLEIPLAIMDRALVHEARSTAKSYSELAEPVFRDSRRWGWGGFALLWHNPVEDVYVPKKVNQTFWEHARNRSAFREKWVSAADFFRATLDRYHGAGLLKNSELHAQPVYR